MKKKLIVIISIVLAILLFGVFYFYVLHPRVLVFLFAWNTFSKLGAVGEEFTEYDVMLEADTFSVDNGTVSLNLPSKYVLDDTVTIADTYRASNEGIAITEASDVSDITILGNVKEDINFLGVHLEATDIAKGFEKLGYGIPDSGYNTFRCIYMIRQQDYNFWNVNQAVAYAYAANLRVSVSPVCDDEIYSYKNDNICGFVLVENLYESVPNAKTRYKIVLEIYDPNDLNTVTSILIKTDSLEEAYGIMNSVKVLE